MKTHYQNREKDIKDSFNFYEVCKLKPNNRSTLTKFQNQKREFLRDKLIINNEISNDNTNSNINLEYSWIPSYSNKNLSGKSEIPNNVNNSRSPGKL